MEDTRARNREGTRGSRRDIASRESTDDPGSGALPPPRKGRGALSNRTGRYEGWKREPFDDGWDDTDPEPPRLRTTLTRDTTRSVIAYNRSPDVPFDRSINPYRGCEHGCIYCFARPTHAYLGLSPGLDFESKLLYKPDAPALLRKELSHPRYRCAVIALGANTDPYQPVERKLELTRRILQVLQACAHPVTVVTKSALVERDIDILASMAARRLASVAVSVTTLDRGLARRMEPRATAPERRLRTIRTLTQAGVPVSALVAPVIPVLTDPELESILARAREVGAHSAGYVLLRLPLEIKDLFQEWLRAHYPLAADHVLRRIRDTRGGKLYDSTFGQRKRGRGAYADLVDRRFALACKRLGFPGAPALDCTRFTRPGNEGQLSLL